MKAGLQPRASKVRNRPTMPASRSRAKRATPTRKPARPRPRARRSGGWRRRLPVLEQRHLDLIGLGLFAAGVFVAFPLYLAWDGGAAGGVLVDGLQRGFGRIAYLIPIGLVAAGGGAGPAPGPAGRAAVPRGRLCLLLALTLAFAAGTLGLGDGPVRAGALGRRPAARPAAARSGRRCTRGPRRSSATSAATSSPSSCCSPACSWRPAPRSRASCARPGSGVADTTRVIRRTAAPLVGPREGGDVPEPILPPEPEDGRSRRAHRRAAADPRRRRALPGPLHRAGRGDAAGRRFAVGARSRRAGAGGRRGHGRPCRQAPARPQARPPRPSPPRAARSSSPTRRSCASRPSDDAKPDTADQDRVRPGARRGARPSGRGRQGRRHRRGPAHHPLRAAARARDQDEQGREPQGRPGLRARRDRHPHPRPDPRQAGGRRRGAQPPPAHRHARRRLRQGPRRGQPAHRLPRQGRQRQARPRRPGEDAAPPRRRHHRRRQVGLRQRDAQLDPAARHARPGPARARRPQAGRAEPLRGDPASADAGHHEPAHGGQRPPEPRAGDGVALRDHVRRAYPLARRAEQAPRRRRGRPAPVHPVRHRRAGRPDDGRARPTSRTRSSASPRRRGRSASISCSRRRARAWTSSPA